MLTFDHRDFTRSALSLAGGMFGVALVAGWRSGGDIRTMSLTLGLPFGVLAFWATYSLRMKRQQEELRIILEQQAKGVATASTKTPESVQPKLQHQSARGLTLEATHQLPRFRRRAKTAPATKEGQDNPINRDQWHL